MNDCGMNVREIKNIGSGQTTVAGPTSLIVIDQLPPSGGWSITGQVQAFAPGNAYLFQVAMNGYCTGGVATETDEQSPPYTKVPTGEGVFAALALALIGTGATAIASGPILEIQATGIAGPTIIDWAWDLTLVFVDAPLSST